MSRKKTMFRVAIQKYEDGKPKKFKNISVNEEYSLKQVQNEVGKRILEFMFEE